MTAAAFPKEIQKYVEQGNYSPDLIIRSKYHDEPAFPRENIQVLKLRIIVTLLLGMIVSGTLSLKPMWVYHFQTSRASKGLTKDMLPFYWKWNKKACVTKVSLTNLVRLEFLFVSIIILVVTSIHL